MIRKKSITKADRIPLQIHISEKMDTFIKGTDLIVQLQNFCRTHGIEFSDIWIDAEGDTYHGETTAMVTLNGYRLETSIEVAARIAQIEAKNDADYKRAVDSIDQERKLYERLKKKFG